MRDTELYRHLLGLVDPWEVSRVELSVEAQRVDVWVEHPRGTRFACPECGAALPVYDHSEARTWRHLDSCQFLTYLHGSPPRVNCAEHGVRQARLPWAEPMSRFTMLFERLAIDVLSECDVEGACRVLRVSWDEGWRLMERAVSRGLLRRLVAAPVHVGVDEKAAGRGQDYITVVSDIDAGTVRFMAERKESSLRCRAWTSPSWHSNDLEPRNGSSRVPFVAIWWGFNPKTSRIEAASVRTTAVPIVGRRMVNRSPNLRAHQWR